MSIGLFIDGAYLLKTFREHIDYVKLRQHIETTLGDTIDEGYFFNADTDPPKAEKLHNALTLPLPRGPGLRVKIYWLQKKTDVLAKTTWRPASGSSRQSRNSV